jgi:hypothetical protein
MKESGDDLTPTPGGIQTAAVWDIRTGEPYDAKGRPTITVHRGLLQHLPQETAEQRNRRAIAYWHAHQNLAPLTKLLAVGEANTVAQKLAAELLNKATQKRLPDLPGDAHLHFQMYATYLFAIKCRYSATEARIIVEDLFEVSRQAVDKLRYAKTKPRVQLRDLVRRAMEARPAPTS